MTREEHVQDVKTALQLLRDHSLYIKAKKSAFGLLEIQYLGYIINAKKSAFGLLKIQYLEYFPTISQDICMFVGLYQAYSSHMNCFSTLSAPLTDLLNG